MEEVSNGTCVYNHKDICQNLSSPYYGGTCVDGDILKPTCFGRTNNWPDVIPIENNPVNHPNHYTQGGIECIKAIEASMSPEGFQDYCKGNVQKYIWRWRDKNGLEDLKKAQVYLGWLIESVEKENVEDEH